MTFLLAHGSGLDDLVVFVVLVGGALYFIRRTDKRIRSSAERSGQLSSDSDE